MTERQATSRSPARREDHRCKAHEVAGWDATTFESHAVSERSPSMTSRPRLDIGPSSSQQIFVDADGATILIRREVFHEAPVQLEQVLAVTRGGLGIQTSASSPGRTGR